MTVSYLFSVFIVVLVIGVIDYLIHIAPFISSTFKQILRFGLIIIAIFYLLNLVGVLPTIGLYKIG